MKQNEFEELVYCKAKELANAALGFGVCGTLKNIQIKKTKEMKRNPCVMGVYYPKDKAIFVNPSAKHLKKKKVVKVVLHELGHHIHHEYLDFKPQYIRRKKKGDESLYCNKDQRESFAECFADYAWACGKRNVKKIYSSKRLSKMERILNTLSPSK